MSVKVLFLFKRGLKDTRPSSDSLDELAVILGKEHPFPTEILDRTFYPLRTIYERITPNKRTLDGLWDISSSPIL